MVKIKYSDIQDKTFFVPSELIKNKRNLTEQEIKILEKNLNTSDCRDWKNVFVSSKKDEFNPQLIQNSHFSGFVILGKLKNGTLKYHDLELSMGIYNSTVINVEIGDDVVINNVKYLKNYRLGNHIILFNIQEMSCTNHAKFGNGWIKDDEPESNRIWIGVSNENGNRGVLPFESLIPADAYIWSRRRSDKKLMERFVELTEYDNTKKLDTFGTVEDDVVIKNTTLLKDAKIGSCAYIKGAFKLKNITVLSNSEEPSQIGEGVELVNGIIGYGSHIFYQAVAVRFVIGRNCQLKYGARLLNSILGDNSTVSCCELLNNLIFPFHEQHHNTSFLIATTILGQSNIAAGATIGSNHNSRSPDGEIIAGRGFWPGLCSDFKHNSKFASFVLVAKGSYQHELNIIYPFSLVAFKAEQEPVHIIPAYWFLFNMFAIARNNYKFKKRDKRAIKVQHIETDPMAPDTIQEVIVALERLIFLTRNYLKKIGEESVKNALSDEEELQAAKDYLHQNIEADFTLFDEMAQKKYGATIFKPVKAYKEYRKILKYFAARAIVDYCKTNGYPKFSREVLEKMEKISLFTQWQNLGGQIVPTIKVDQLCDKIKTKEINTWEEVHAYYDSCFKNYELYKTRYALYILERLYSRSILEFDSEIWQDIVDDVTLVSTDMYRDSISSRHKDYTDPFRVMTYETQEEMTAVLGTIDDIEFLHILRQQTEVFNRDLRVILGI